MLEKIHSWSCIMVGTASWTITGNRSGFGKSSNSFIISQDLDDSSESRGGARWQRNARQSTYNAFTSARSWNRYQLSYYFHHLLEDECLKWFPTRQSCTSCDLLGCGLREKIEKRQWIIHLALRCHLAPPRLTDDSWALSSNEPESLLTRS